ncbi:MAG TPA: ABC transporter ATP-binding protein [Thermoplasmata archaeon]|nr:ABC transporter ATP-binding protein [Thermoplasmata archaeon]
MPDTVASPTTAPSPTPPKSPEYVVIARNVWKTYGQGETAVTALRGVTLGIPRGRMIAIMGPSGCGKTTLLNCFSGLDEVTRGTVTLEGVDIHRMPDRLRSEYRARRTGFVFQNYNLLPVLSAVENTEMPLLVAGVSLRDARERALGILQELGLADRVNHRPSELSGGQQQRVALARALVARPAIVWADEPTGNLDEEGAHQVTELLRELNREYRQTMVVVTHDADVAALCDRTYKMRDGQFVR